MFIVWCVEKVYMNSTTHRSIWYKPLCFHRKLYRFKIKKIPSVRLWITTSFIWYWHHVWSKASISLYKHSCYYHYFRQFMTIFIKIQLGRKGQMIYSTLSHTICFAYPNNGMHCWWQATKIQYFTFFVKCVYIFTIYNETPAYHVKVRIVSHIIQVMLLHWSIL